MKIADVFFAAQLEDAGLQRAAGTAGDKAGKTMGASISTSLRPLAASGFGLTVGHEAFDILKKGIAGTFDLLGDSIAKASDMNETLSKSKVIFGDSAAEIERWGNTAAKSIGLSKQAAIEGAASLGNLLEGANVDKAAAADMSKRLVGLAGDLASFNNIDPTAALEKLRSGLVGEAEPLRELGVTLSEAKVKAKAMQMGLGNAHGELTEGQKVLARYQVILDETKTAQGDFAKTSDGLANSQRIVNAELEDQQAKLGAKLLPLQLAWTRSELDTVSVIGDLIDAVDAASQSFDEHADKVGNARKQLGFVQDVLHFMPPEFVKTITGVDNLGAAFDQLVTGVDDATAANKAFTGTSEDARLRILAADNAVNGLNINLGLVPSKAGPSATAIDKVGKAAGDAAPKLYDMFHQYTVAVTRGDVAQDTLDLLDNAKAVAAAKLAVEKATPGTAAYRKAQLELTVAQGKLAQAHERLIDDQLILFDIKPDKKTAAALDMYFQGLGKGILNLDTKAQDAYRSVQRLLHPETGNADVEIIIRYGGKPQKFGGGGPAKAHVPIIVGDAGIPELFVPDVNGTILDHVPAGFGGSPGGGPVYNTTINYADPSRGPEDFGRTLRRLGALGIGS